MELSKEEKQQIILGKMRRIRDIREKEIFEQNIEREENGQKPLSISVKEVKYLGNINWVEEVGENKVRTLKDLYIAIEENDGKTVYRYYDEDFNLIAAEQKGLIIEAKEFADKKDKTFLEEIKSKDKEGERTLSKEEKERTDKIQKEIQKEEAKDNGEQKINAEEMRTIKGIQEIDLDTKVNENETLRDILDLSDDFVKLEVVYSEKINELSTEEKSEHRENTKFSFVAVDKKGNAQTISDKLELDLSSGADANNEALKIKHTGEVNKDSKTNSRYKIKDKSDSYLSIQQANYGEAEIYYGGKTKDGNEPVETQLETDNIMPTSREIRETQSNKKEMYAKDRMADEANKHFEEANEEKINLKDADGKEETYSHLHTDKEHIQDVAQLIYNNNESIQNAFTLKEVTEMTERLFVKTSRDFSLSDTDKLKLIEETIESDAENLQKMHNHKR